MGTGAMRVLIEAMDDLVLDVEYGTAALVSRNDLPEMRRTIEHRIDDLLQEADILDGAERSYRLHAADQLQDCKGHLDAREREEFDPDAEHTAAVAERVMIASFAFSELMRARDMITSRSDAPFAAELAARHGSSAEALAGVRSALDMTASLYGIRPDHLPPAESIHRAVRGELEQIFAAVLAARESDAGGEHLDFDA